MLEYKIGVVGPSRIGKTTLMTCVLEAGETLFKDSGFGIVPCEDGTEAAIEDNKNDLYGAVKSGAIGFNAAALGGDEDYRLYNFLLKNGDDEVLKLSFMDYPGGWLKTKPDEWKNKCEPHIKESRILLIPVDAALVMEANMPQYEASVPSLLQLSSVESVVRKWAKAQWLENKGCCIILAPVKCETYLKNKKEELERAILSYYKGILSVAKEELGESKVSNLRIYYCPIITLGCVTLKKVDWLEKENETGKYEFSANYMATELHPKRKQEYAGYILKLIVETICGIDKKDKNKILQMNKKEEEEALNDLRRINININDLKDKKSKLGFFASIWEWFTNEKQKEIDKMGNIRKKAEDNYVDKIDLTEKANDEYRQIVELFNYIIDKKVDNCSKDMTGQIK